MLRPTLPHQLAPPSTSPEVFRPVKSDTPSRHVPHVSPTSLPGLARIARELASPASLVLGPMQEIFSKTTETTTRRQAALALQNAKSMVRLLDQVLTLEKVGSGQLSLAVQAIDLVEFVRTHTAHFQTSCQQKSLRFCLDPDTDAIPAHLDPELLGQILNHLLANAIQHSQKGDLVKVKLSLQTGEPETIAIAVQDSGAGIKDEILPYIFEPFYQNETRDNKGAGLALVKQLAELHGGTIRLKSIEGLGTEVVLRLPRFQDHLAPQQASGPTVRMRRALTTDTIRPFPSLSDEWEANENTGNLILLVDEIADRRDFLRLALEPAYRIVEADSGETGLAKAHQLVPDLIICASQIKVCPQLKEAPTTAHIPVVLLTDGRPAQLLEALQAGADACANLHLEMSILRAQIKQLLEQRKQLRAHFRSEMIAFSPVTEATSQEDQFLANLQQAMSENLSNEHFTVENLARELAMSRTQLHRKIKAIGGQSATAFMRNFRLEHAFQLLENNVAPVGEIAFMVGFASASHFSRAFSAKFGKSPKSVRKPAGPAKQLFLSNSTTNNIRISA